MVTTCLKDRQGSFTSACITQSSILPLLCAGPNHGGVQTSPVTKLDMFYVVMVQQDGLKVKATSLSFFIDDNIFPGFSCET